MNNPIYWKLKSVWWSVKHWWNYRWFRRNEQRCRNIAIWGVNHQLNGGYEDRSMISRGYCDQRIRDAAYGKSKH